jgi:hypothetical protein
MGSVGVVQTARVFYLDADRRVVATRDVAFNSRVDLVNQVEKDLGRFWAIEAWRENDCVLCLNAHGSIETRCGKAAPPVERTCCC